MPAYQRLALPLWPQVQEDGQRGIRCMAVGLAEGVGPWAHAKPAHAHGPMHAEKSDLLPSLNNTCGRRWRSMGGAAFAAWRWAWRRAAGPGALLGLLTFLDPPRPDTRDTLEKALGYGVDTKMARPPRTCRV